MATLPSKSSIIERNAGMMGKSAQAMQAGVPPTGQPAMAPLAGQPLPQNGAALAAGGDNMNAQITDHMGQPQGPATIKSGEIVFSVDSVIGAGNGDYDKGAKLLLGLHDKLQDHGEAIVQKQSLSGASPSPAAPPGPPQGLAAPSPIPGPVQGLPGGTSSAAPPMPIGPA
jgi:hypothetical protein